MNCTYHKIAGLDTLRSTNRDAESTHAKARCRYWLQDLQSHKEQDGDLSGDETVHIFSTLRVSKVMDDCTSNQLTG